MKYCKIVAAVAALFLVGASMATALSVDEEEIRKYGDVGGIRFENYTGPHSVIETADAITEIGRGLGRQVAARVTSSASYGLNGKYAIIHAVDPSTGGKFDADILIINPNATVDHIRNLRRIIAGYLSAAYGYSNADATTLATFVTVYNAVYRGRMDVFEERYKPVVTRNLTASKCGLSTVWNEWPGNSQIVIPLYDLNGGISTIDTSVISDKNVIDNMREQDDKGIDVRKDMVDIMEREAEQAQQKADEAARQAEEEQRRLQQQQQAQQNANQAAQQAQQNANQAQQNAQNAQQNANQAQQNAQNAQQNANQAQQNAQQAQQNANANPNDQNSQQAAQQAQQDAQKAQEEARRAQEEARRTQEEAERAAQEAQRRQEEARRAQEEAAAQQQRTNEQQQRTTEAEQRANEQQEFADKKSEEAQNARTEIAKDQQRLLEEALAVSETNTVIGLKVVNDAKDLSQMVKVNTDTSNVVRLSPVTVIHRRVILPVSDPVVPDAPANAGSTYYMAICGDTSASANSAVKLCLLDSGNMEIQKESNEQVAPDSVLVTDGSSYYCVIRDGSNWVVGKYDKSLNLLLKSPVPVEANTPITFASNLVVVTDSSGTVILLNARDLMKK